ncbi:eukaryotic translation initiation factor 3 subunit I [Sphaeroforma arctica JP610]|uniref:Eukaryotic translation initiation factor 3 subunit I n=1 Tax=Sphaeroforma arctica JP610 TaxID=667725 RepID=A0A0L0GFU2_9EUKA|nr:eukaryotic translation initiation factor 3 subunit I [Sphaeroforma arctica JP610]KNC87148.1 eukaryotic translation initiation factor 3 subunit I [Sphaeroforma arctica JP610]|eukprot:XP_014161050.1 eukaryotic translation initiation factor 3 subunit I [Sphaeroforma arctica JP610]
MKPIMCYGHERSLTQIRYNRSGDLLFSVAKDTKPTVWFSHNGERLGTYKGHKGACWSIDVNWDSTHVVTGAADNTARVWDCETGTELHKLGTETAVRTVRFNEAFNQLAVTTDQRMGFPCEIRLFDLNDSSQMKNNKPHTVVELNDSKVTTAEWGPYDDTYITGHENGEMKLWDIKTWEPTTIVAVHDAQVNDIQMSPNRSCLITASKDHNSKLLDPKTFEVLKTYKTDRPVNSASISPIRDHVLLGGGQDARDVTTTSTRAGKFEVRFFHEIFEEEIGRVKGHFGPINTVQFHPDGTGFASGGEDGYIRLHHFDQDYFNFQFAM